MPIKLTRFTSSILWLLGSGAILMLTAVLTTVNGFALAVGILLSILTPIQIGYWNWGRGLKWAIITAGCTLRVLLIVFVCLFGCYCLVAQALYPVIYEMKCGAAQWMGRLLLGVFIGAIAVAASIASNMKFFEGR